jgi:ZIP family zinc transporter
LLFTFGNLALARYGAKHRKRSGDQLADAGTGGGALALGALLDGIPEATVIGVSLLAGEGVGLVAVIAVFLSNIPEGLASASGMRRAGYSTRSVILLWCAITLASALAAGLGCYLLTLENTTSIAFVQALAAGAILTMVVDTMVPEAFAEAHDFSGLIAVVGFLAAFVLSQSQSG